MKNLKYFFGMLLLAGMVGLVSCKDDEKKPDFTADYPDAPKVDGKITIFAKFEAGLCENGVVVLNGSHNLVEGGTAWNTVNPTEMPKFVSAGVIGDKDWGAEGWWKVTVDLSPGAAYPEKGSGAILGAKPVHLKDGKFYWDYQIGYFGVADVEVKSGDVFLDPKAENNECDIFFESNVTAAIIFKTWKNDPCVNAPKHDVTFSVTVPASTPNDAVVRIVGSFGTSGYSDWGQDAEDMILTKGANGKYSIKLNLNEGNIQYKYVLNGNWDFEESTENCTSISNRTLAITGVATVNNEVINWKGFGDCAPSGETHTYTFVVTVPEGTPADAVVRIVGSFGHAGYPNWNETSDDMKLVKGANGKYSITLADVEEGTEYKYVLNGSWNFEERGADNGSDCAPGIDGNRKTPSSENEEVTVENTVENWKGVTTCIE